MTYPPVDYDAHPELVAHGRELDRALWPVIDRIAVRLGTTREALIAEGREAAARGAAQNRDQQPSAPILDKTCWHCGQTFETRRPTDGLCPPCERLADEDTRVTRIEG